MEDEFDLLRRIEKAHTLATQLEGAAKPKSLGTDNSSSSAEVKSGGVGGEGGETQSVEEYSGYKIVSNEGEGGEGVGAVAGESGEVRGPDGRLLC